MRFAHPLPWWSLVLLALVAGLVLARVWIDARLLPRPRRILLTGLRGAVLAMLVVAWMRPVAVRPAPSGGGLAVPVLIDASRSMLIRDVGGQSRLDAAVDLVRRGVLPALKGRARVEPFFFGHQVVAADLSRAPNAAARSDLTGALRYVTERFRGEPIGGIVVVSDGAVTVPAAGTLAGTPVLAVGVGNPTVSRDREVLSVTLGDPSVTGSVVDLTALVVSHGYGVATFDVRLFEDGSPADVRQVTPVADGSPMRVAFRVVPRPGRPTVFTVDVAPAADEMTDGNNRASVLAPPPARTRRVLMLEGAPGFEHSFLKRALDGDPGLQVDAVVRKGRDDAGRETYYVQAARERAGALVSGFPQDRVSFFAYDGVVLANYEAGTLAREQMQWVRDFVAERGGGVVLLGARSFESRGLDGTALEDVIPLRLAGEPAEPAPTGGATGAVQPTADGETHPIMRLGSELSVRRAWDGLPALASLARLGGPRPGAAVLARARASGGEVRPLIAVQRFGRGRVFAFTGDAAWRWKMQLPSSDRRYEMFWRQAVRWVAAPAQDPVAAETLLTSLGSADVLVRARTPGFESIRDATVTVRATAPDGTSSEQSASLRDSEAGLYGTPVALPQPGMYRVEAVARQGERELGRAETWALAGGTDPELVDPRRNDEVLRRVADATGGRLMTAGDVASVARFLKAPVGARATVEEKDLWHTWWVFLAIAGLACAEWVLRRRWGLR